jgi:hypothetical protein
VRMGQVGVERTDRSEASEGLIRDQGANVPRMAETREADGTFFLTHLRYRGNTEYLVWTDQVKIHMH